MDEVILSSFFNTMFVGGNGTCRQGEIMRMFDPGGFSCRYKLYFLLTGYLNLSGVG